MVSETIELRGHIIDSLILPKVLDQILTRGAGFKISEIRVGEKRTDQSFARIEVSAPNGQALDELILRLRQHGAEPVKREDAHMSKAPADGVFPRDFYVTTDQQTFVRLDGREIEVQPAMMDSAVAVDRKGKTARAVKFFDVRKDDEIIVGHQGVRVVPVQRTTSHTDPFQFISGIIGPDEPKSAVIREIGAELRRARSAKGKIAVVAGKAVALSGAGEHLERLIELGYVHRLFAGNAFAAYDVERALFGTSLGVSVSNALPAGGHENHLRAINVIRGAGGFSAAVKANVLTRGLMYACIHHKVDLILAGSIRDDGPLPGVITDSVEAQKIMREKLSDVKYLLLLGTVQFSMAVSSMVAPAVKTVCVDIDPGAVAQVVKHQPFYSIGLVTDVEPFLRELTESIANPPAGTARSTKK